MVERSRFCSLSSNVCHTDGKGEGIRWRTRTPERKAWDEDREIQYVIIFAVFVLLCWVYLCLGMVYDHLERDQPVYWARNIARCQDDPQAGSWSVNAFLRI